MAEIIPQHIHCLVCGKSINVGETLCSDKCKQKYNKMFRRRKLLLYLMYGMLFAVIVLFVILNK